MIRAVIVAVALMNAESAAADVTYTYNGQAQTAYVGTALNGAAIQFAFSTPTTLPDNLAFDVTSGLVPPFYSVPVTSWSLTVGPYTLDSYRDGLPGLYFLGIQTNNTGQITGWAFDANEYTFDGTSLLSVAAENPHPFPTIFGPSADSVQVNPSAFGATFTQFSQTDQPGSWIKGGAVLPSPGLPPTPTAPPPGVPETETWILMTLGLAGIGAALRGARRQRLSTRMC